MRGRRDHRAAASRRPGVRLLVRSFALALTGIATALASASCGSSDADVCRHYYEAVCEREASCNPHAFDWNYFPNVSACVERFSLLCPTELALPNTNFHAETLSRCADEISSATCEAFNGPPTPACLEAYRGTLEGGDACIDDEQCLSGFCNVPKNSQPFFACGTCEKLLAEGDDCGGSAGVCDHGFRCAQHVCVPYSKLDEACGNIDDCDVGLSCIGGLCAPPLEVDQLCSNQSECNANDAQICRTSTGVCEVLDQSYWNGQCGFVPKEDTEFYVSCHSGFYCTAPSQAGHGKCLPVLADGDPCSGSFYDPCYWPAICVAGTCQVPTAPACGTP